MPDVVNINGYNIKDSQAREDIADIQKSISPRTTGQDIITNSNMSGLVYYAVQNGICTVTISATPKASYSGSTGVTITTTAPQPAVAYGTIAGRASDNSLLDIYHQGNTIKFTHGRIKSAPNNSYNVQYSYPVKLS